MKKPKVTVRSVVHMSDEEKLALLLGGETGVSESLTTQAMIPQADLLVLAKALEDAIVERETYVHGEGWDVADMGVQRARAAFTSALAAQQERWAEREAIYKNQIEAGAQRIAAQQERIVGLRTAALALLEACDRADPLQAVFPQQMQMLREALRIPDATPGTPAAGVWVPDDATVGRVAYVLDVKFGQQTGHHGKDFWRPIARAALIAAKP
jgi:hypothetical protein